MSRLLRKSLLLWGLTIVLVSPAVRGEDPQDDDLDGFKLAEEMISAIQVRGILEDGSEYDVPTPRMIMKFVDPQRGTRLDAAQAGTLWAWGDGRPVAFAELWRSSGQQAWGHALISTTPQNVTASVDGMEWKPEYAGLTLQELPSAPTPPEDKGERLAQMKELAGRFSGTETVGTRVLDLYMVPEPLLVYQEQESDGAVFALARNGNPAAILFLEIVEGSDGDESWHYGWVKATSSPVTIMMDGTDFLQIHGALTARGGANESFWVFVRQPPEAP